MHDDLLLQIPTSLMKLPMLGKEIISSPSFSEGPSVLRNVYIFMPTIAVARNKNRYLMSYLMWRVLTGFHEEIKDLFSSGWPHQICTKLVLWIIQAALSSNQSRMFGRHSNLSSTPNVAQLVGGQDDSTIVPMYDKGFYFDDNTPKRLFFGEAFLSFDKIREYCPEEVQDVVCPMLEENIYNNIIYYIYGDVHCITTYCITEFIINIFHLETQYATGV